MFRYLVLGWLVMPTCLAAEDRPVSPEEFERLVLGETMSFIGTSGLYGAEEYFGDRRVRWSFLDGTCTDGRWFNQGNQICFQYDDGGNAEPQCWSFYMKDDALVGEYDNGGQTAAPVQMQMRSGPLYCLSPEVGA